jgi:hypothetical protein
MFKILEMNSFRGFKQAQLVGLSRINIVTGTNGSGKTSILEAAFLVSGAANASMAASLSGFRGEHAWAVDYELPFLSLFQNLDPSIVPILTASSSILQKKGKKHFRQLEIKPVYSVTEGKASTNQKTKLSGIEFLFSGPSGKVKNSWGWQQNIPKEVLDMISRIDGPHVAPNVLGGKPSINPDMVEAHFVSPYVRELMHQDYPALTQLSKSLRMGEVVDVLKIIHSSIKNIVPLTEGSLPVIYADIGEEKLLPISLLGAGVSNLMHIVLPLINVRNGLILIDEFEDGIHHSLFGTLLKIAFDLAKKNNNQIFISTHSNELLREIISVSSDEVENEISFFRLGRRGLSGVIPRYTLKEAHELLDARLDIR